MVLQFTVSLNFNSEKITIITVIDLKVITTSCEVLIYQWHKTMHNLKIRKKSNDHEDVQINNC
jgi:hypothetical protein